MTALRAPLAFNGPVASTASTRAVFASIGACKALALLKNMALFLVSPFIGLAYAVLLPFVGLGILLWVATEGLRKPAPRPELAVAEPVRADIAVTVAVHAAPATAESTSEPSPVLFVLKLLAAPFIGLAALIAAPFIAVGALVWALAHRKA
ncbi:hypothetical protein [Ramlibacter alkalitolerans]|uniref:Uncharacterized protein n=1 Tax=Ramlibacter alkalitolerans TaxID=2039631 RepID=A0ABS1JTW7_9BURK|nr:hypothetical protein [Ramlibacter alkalitolerans]MBL0427662.1 hypothetical protein [Ramlibacter alkalitolerans]